MFPKLCKNCRAIRLQGRKETICTPEAERATVFPTTGGHYTNRVNLTYLEKTPRQNRNMVMRREAQNWWWTQRLVREAVRVLNYATKENLPTEHLVDRIRLSRLYITAYKKELSRIGWLVPIERILEMKNRGED